MTDMTRHITYVPAPMLQRLIKQGWEAGYNRQLPGELYEALDMVPDVRFPVTFAMAHHHIQGQPAPAHVRLVLYLGSVLQDVQDQVAILDVSLEAYGDLPELTFRKGVHA